MIKLRPHHLICNLGFQGKGYSEEFVNNFQTIQQQLVTNPNKLLIEIAANKDDICRCCPHLQNEKCNNDTLAANLDQAYAQILDLTTGAIFSFQSITVRIQQYLQLANFQRICAQCQWKNLGFCEFGLRKIISVKSLMSQASSI